MNIDQKIFNYLLDRGISEKVILRNHLAWNGTSIVIPVYYGSPDISKVCFNKYRKNPFEELNRTEPKYRYDKGATFRIYNEYKIYDNHEIIICEGELDSLVLETQGYAAVSSTGGSSSFSTDWSNLFDRKTVYICYDHDNAGVKGALRVQSIIPHAKIIWLPTKMKGKDITDYFKEYSRDDFEKLKAESKSYPIPGGTGNYPDKLSLLKQLKSEYNILLASYQNEYAEATSRDDERYWYPEVISEIQKRLLPIDRRIKYFKEESDKGGDFRNLIIEAKKVPIDTVLDFNQFGKSFCLWHTEKTQSLHYYEATNTVHCFGGCGHKDAIDVYMEFHKCDFKEAVYRMNGISNERT